MDLGFRNLGFRNLGFKNLGLDLDSQLARFKFVTFQNVRNYVSYGSCGMSPSPLVLGVVAYTSKISHFKILEPMLAMDLV